jgi:diacylglycerol kinase family enzyme
MVKAVFGRLKPAQDSELIRTAEIEISSRSARLRVAADGELEKMPPPLRYRIRPRALRVIVPPLTTP